MHPVMCDDRPQHGGDERVLGQPRPAGVCQTLAGTPRAALRVYSIAGLRAAVPQKLLNQIALFDFACLYRPLLAVLPVLLSLHVPA